MDRRRAAGALLALAACIACSAAAPTASNQTALDLYEGAPEGCYYNFQHYGEGDRIMTNEPCLNCTCHNRMLMCYLRVCPFTKAIGQDCTVEKRADQCCPIVTCPDVPVDLLTSTSTTSPAEYGATGLGKPDKYGCSINGKYFSEGSKVPPTPNKPCEHCYCIRNMTTCVMQECTLHVDGCTPIYHKDVCCPVRYSCDHPEDEVPLLDDMSTTVRPTPGFLLTTTTVAPVTQMTQDCVHDDKIFADGALIKTEKACEHCYCMKGDIVCVVQECGAPMENEGKNCTSLPPREGQCCPDTYICEGDELSSDLPLEPTTELFIEKLTTLSPPRRAGVEGSGYRNEPDETYTEIPTIESELEGSGEEQDTSKPLQPEEIPITEDEDNQYISVITKAPTFEHQQTTEINRDIIPDENIEEETVEPQVYLPTTNAPVEEVEKLTTSGVIEEENFKPHEHVPTNAPEGYEKTTTESSELLNTVPDELPEEGIAHEYVPTTTSIPKGGESESPSLEGQKDEKLSEKEPAVTVSALPVTSKPEYNSPSYTTSDEIGKSTDSPDEVPNVTTEVTEKEYFETDSGITGTTSAIATEESENPAPQENESYKPEPLVPSTTSSSVEEDGKLTTQPDHAQNTVAIAEEETTEPHSHIPTATIGLPSVEEETTTVSNLEQNMVTDKVIKDDVYVPHDDVSTAVPPLIENVFTTSEPDKGLNTIPSEINEESSSEASVPEITTLIVETKATESSIITEEQQKQDVDIKPTTVSETLTSLPESIITKGDQYTITTEPSFRKEDESSVSTEKPKEFEPTTVKAEFVEEDLIPTSPLDERFETSPDVPSIEEDLTTSVPEYTKDIEETIGLKQTTESILETSVMTESLPGKVPEHSSEKESELPSSTEKTSDITAFVPEDVENHEVPSRIPGEGDCLLNGVTYRNNTVVPSTNNCHTGCRCASSIIKCDPIICSPPPDYMDNCQSIYDSPDSCCPTYVCDHPKETVPPQSDNQMSGTESPMGSPTIECRGDQCEITEPSQPPVGPSDTCTSGSCSAEAVQKPEIQCGPEGCGPSKVHGEECTDGKCKPASCANGDCQLPQTQGQVSPIKPCEGEHCEKVDGVLSPPQLCQNEEDCKALETPVIQAIPCEGESCKKIDCGDSGCDFNAIASPQDAQQVPCNEEGGCKPHDCTGDEPCRRKEVSTADEKPLTECEGSDCKYETETTVIQDFKATESPTPDQTPTKVVSEEVATTDAEKATEIPEADISKPEDMVTVSITDTDTYTTEGQSDTKIPEKDDKKPAIFDEENKEKPTVVLEEGTEKPIMTEREGTEYPTDIDEKETEKPAVIYEEGKEKPDIVEREKTEEPVAVGEEGTDKPSLLEDAGEKKPTLVKEEGIDKPIVIDEEGTEIPSVYEEAETEKPVFIPGIETEKPVVVGDEAEEKPVVIEENVTTKPEISEEEGTEQPTLIDGEVKDKPSFLEEVDTDKPALTEKEGTEQPVIIQEEGTEKPSLIGEDIDKKQATERPSLIDGEGKEKPAILEEVDTDKPIFVKEDMEEPAIIDEQGKEKPDVHENINTDKPVIEREGTELPTIIQEQGTEIPAMFGEDEEKKPAIIKEQETERPTLIDQEGNEKPAVVEQERTEKPIVQVETTEKPADVDEEGTNKPIITEEENKDKPGIIDEEGVENPAEIEQAHKEQPAVIGQVDTEKPAVDEEDGTTEQGLVDVDVEVTEKPVIIDEYGNEKPVIIDEEHPLESEKEHKEKPAATSEDGTEKPALVHEKDKEQPVTEVEGTVKPAIVSETDKDKPTAIEEQTTGKPTIIEREGTEYPVKIGDEDTEKPSLIDEENKDKPDIVEKEGTEKPAVIEIEKTEKPAVDDEGTEKPEITEGDVTKKPDSEMEDSDKPAVLETENTDKPAVAEEQGTEKPSIIDEEGLTMPPVVDKEDSEKLAVTETESTDKPVPVKDEGTEKPDMFDEEGTKKPIAIEMEDGEKPAVIETESTDKPADVKEEGTEKPSIIDMDGTNIPPIVEEVEKEKPAINEEEGTQKPDSLDKEEGTEVSATIDEEGTEKPGAMVDDGEVKPTIDREDLKKPAIIEEEGMEKPVVAPEEGKDKPAIIDEDLTEKPAVSEKEGTKDPDLTDEEEGSGTELPEIYSTKPVKEVTENLEQPTESNINELEKVTKSPIYESQTTPVEDVHAYYTQSNTEEPMDVSTPYQEIVPSEIPEIKVPEPQDSDIKVPAILDDSSTPKITESLTNQEMITKTPLSPTISEEAMTAVPEKEKEPITVSTVTEQNVQATSPKFDTTGIIEEGSTIGQDMTIDEAAFSTKAPELYETTELIEKATKPTESESIGGQEEIFTDTPELGSLTTKVPEVGPMIIKPQEDLESENPELPAVTTSKTEEESITKIYEEDKIKPVPQSQITDGTKTQTIVPDYESTTTLPEQSETPDQISEIPVITDKQKYDSPEPHDTEPEKMATKLPVDINEEEIKPGQPEVVRPDKEVTITETPVYSVTEPVRRFTEIEDSFVTGLEEIGTGYPEEATEHRLPSATDKTDEGVETSTASSEKPMLVDVESPELPVQIPETEKPVDGLQEQSTQAPETENEKPTFELPATEIPISVVTESQEISHDKDITSFEEKPSSSPDLLDQIHKGTIPPEGYTKEQEADTVIPHYHVTMTEEHSKATESIKEVTEVPYTSTKLEESEVTDTQAVTTEVPRTSVRDGEAETKIPELMYTETYDQGMKEQSITEIQKSSTELPTPSDDVQTEQPDVHVTSEIPQSLVTEHQEDFVKTTFSSIPKEGAPHEPELLTTQFQESTKVPDIYVPGQEEIRTETPVHITESVETGIHETEQEIIGQQDTVTKVPEEAVTEKQDTLTTLRETPTLTEEVTNKPEPDTKLPEVTTVKQFEDLSKSTEQTSVQAEFSETTPYLIELEEHTHKIAGDITTVSPFEEDHTYKTVEDISTLSPSEEDHTDKILEHLSTSSPSYEERTTVLPSTKQEPQVSELTTKKASDEEFESATKEAEITSRPSEESTPEDMSEKVPDSGPVEVTTAVDHKEYSTSAPTQISEESTPTVTSDKTPMSESDIAVPTEKETVGTEKPLHPSITHEPATPEEEFTTKTTTVRPEEEILTPVSDDKYAKPEEKPSETSEVPPPSTTSEVPKPGVSDMQPTDEIPAPEEDGHFPPSGTSGYGEPDYVEEDQAFGPGTCRYGGKVYVSAQQIPRDDPCDFCFCFRSDIICLQQSCPPPIHGCHEEPIQGFCCPRYECPVSMATTVNVTTTTTTTTTTLPPHFPTHSYKGAAQRRGCQIKGHTYKVGEVVRSSSGPCLHCTCGGDGQMKCDPKACTPEPMLRQMIAAAVSAKRRR